MEGMSLYDAVGPTVFQDLVARFYAGVALDPVLRPLYPDEDLTEAQERLTSVPRAVLGRPEHLLGARGHPRLRMRHAGG